MGKKIVIVGGGFGGLYAAKCIRLPDADVTIIDKRNFHLFQPLLYQVATGSLASGNIASPLRRILRRRKIRVLNREALDLDPAAKNLITDQGNLSYDTLIIATGVSQSYFGHDEWRQIAPSLKTVEDAIEMRDRILLAFEHAENHVEPEEQQAFMTIVIVGGGPTGVELAGAIAELSRGTLKDEFREINPERAKVILVEGGPRLLATYSEPSSRRAEEALTGMGVTVMTDTRATALSEGCLVLEGKKTGRTELRTHTVLWAAGVQVSEFGRKVKERTGVETDRAGRLMVESDCTIKEHPEIFVIGDLACFRDPAGQPLPGLAPVAIQQGEYVSRLISRPDQPRRPFRYRDRGSLAVLGRKNAIIEIGRVRWSGLSAWLVWALVHICFLVEFENKISVIIQWAWSYFANGRGSRLITLRNQNRKPADDVQRVTAG